MKRSTTTTTATTLPTQDQIAARARELWLARGQPSGADLEIWLEAESQLRQMTAAADTTTVEPTARGVAKTRRLGKSLSDKVGDTLSDRPGVGQGGNAKILNQTT